METYTSTYTVTSAITKMSCDVYPDLGFVALSLGSRLGSEVRVHLRPSDLDRLSAALVEAHEALHPVAGQGRSLT